MSHRKILGIKGDITKTKVDAIVHAANAELKNNKYEIEVTFVCFDEENYQLYKELFL